MQCGFAAGNVASSVLTAAGGDIPKLGGRENMTTQDMRTSGHNTGLLQLASGTLESVRSCQVPVVSGQSVLTTDKDAGSHK